MIRSHDSNMFFDGGLMWLVWLLLVLAAAWLIKFLASDKSAASASHEAIKLLDQRYARGEINNKEYQRIKQQLIKRGEK